MTTTASAYDQLMRDFADGKRAALARAVSVVENHRAGFDRLLATWQPRLGRARRLGLTGPPGAGKSTLTALLVKAYRDAGLSVGVIAVDPTSPFTGGALLGDRIRMESVALDEGVFIRSMATRGSLGGLAATTSEVADVLDAFGMDRILIETVGVGQSELDISRIADSSAVVLVPESGDSIQTLKAGLMEIADLFVVNKADRPGADRLRNELELMLGLRAGSALRDVPAHHGVDLSRKNPARVAREAAKQTDAEHWTPPVLRTVATNAEGTPEVVAALDRHFHYLERSGELRRRRRRRLRDRVMHVVEDRVRDRLWRDAGTNAWLDDQLPALETGASNPFAVADALLARSGTLLTQVTP
ncbi:MAG TPA: methylmalonyl Co-A mutase-associated GTPase MeaB [Gemmatimonadaceae bacterium]|nr:methylmalonyl Co-A mutase-associated GTPase MeaB [Gemmatimonadaceae bacterium]